MRTLAAALALFLLAPAAHAVRPGSQAKSDAKRFGFDRLTPVRRQSPSAASQRDFAAFKAARGADWKLRFDPRTGLPAALVGGRDYPRPGRPEDAARSFLNAHAPMFGVDPSVLKTDREVGIHGQRHLLFRQTYKGLPVESAAVKVHLDAANAVVGVHSSFEPGLNLPTTPAVPADAAARAAAADAGPRAVARTPSLVVLPLETDGRAHLAWKTRVDAPGGSWRYFVDALTGQVLLRYSATRFIGPCLSSGVVSGSVWDIDPVTTPGPVVRPFNNQYVYVGSPPTQALTQGDASFGKGFFCATVFGKVAMSLQGPWISVGEFRGPGAHYDNGSGVWSTVSTPVSSPHPYPNSSVLVSTINLTVAAPSAVEFLPVFTNFTVGGFSGGAGEGSGDIVDDDQLFVYDQYDHPVASYIGNRGPFRGQAVHGPLMHLVLKSNDSGQQNGYDVAISSYLTLTNANTDGAPTSSHTWTAADQPALGLHGEFSLFYHLNQMHDYFIADVDKSSAAPIAGPVVAMAHVGPDLLNAFYDPDQDMFAFGDVNTLSPSDVFMDDATVPHHEYVHYVVEKIWPIANFGQGGTISEANADYFSASSLNDPHIGRYVVGALGGTGSLRELDCATNPPCYQLGNPLTTWAGEIHDDSPFISQALWDIRKNRVAADPVNGRSCADGLVFQSLFFFPESFSELYEAMLQVDKAGSVAACGGANAVQAVITSAFGAHGLIPSGGDAYEPNDGFETAVDVSTIPSLSATLYPSADQDFYSFGAGPGLVQLTLNLPSAGSGLYKAYQLKLFNAARAQVAGAAPPYNGFGTIDGVCDATDCTTTSSQVVLRYSNPTGGLLYAEVVGGDALNGSNSGVNSGRPYSLAFSFAKPGALSGSIVSASYDRDVISFSVATSSFVRNQDWRFAYAQLRDQGLTAIPNTLTHVPRLTSDYLLFLSSDNAGGMMTGRVQLSTTASFGSRFPAYGTVYLEVFGYDMLQGSTSTASSMGLSNGINLSASQAELTAYNNVFNPSLGQKAVVKYAITSAGHLSVKLYTVTGRLVTTLFDGDAPAGKGSLEWDGRNLSGTGVASGVYVVRADGPGLRTTQKIVVVR